MKIWLRDGLILFILSLPFWLVVSVSLPTPIEIVLGVLSIPSLLMVIVFVGWLFATPFIIFYSFYKLIKNETMPKVQPNQTIK